MPPPFLAAVSSLTSAIPRADVRLIELDPPTRLAPYCHAIGAEVLARGGGQSDGELPEISSGRLVLLHDPAGQDGWQGRFRLVCYIQAQLDPEQVGDELLPAVGWSWLTDALEFSGARFVALGGTVSQTSSERFGGMVGTSRTDDIELRASWTPVGADFSGHSEAFFALLAVAAGLPPTDTGDLSVRVDRPVYPSVNC